MSEIIKISIIAFLGLVFGSFVNAWVWRLSQTLDTDGNTKKLPTKKKKELSILTGRSMCPSCKHVLAAKDLVPVFSWAFLKGKCRYCTAKINPQYPAVELLTAVLFIISGVAWNFNNTLDYVSFACWLGVLTGFVALAIYDIKYMLLPDKILMVIFPLAVIIAVIGVINSNSSLTYTILQLLLAVFVACGLFYILYVLSAGAWIGGGDVKLGVVLGFVLSTALMSVLMLFIASILGVIASIIINRGFQKKAKIPFGPFLIVGTYITVLYGGGILDWYINLLTYGL